MAAQGKALNRRHPFRRWAADKPIVAPLLVSALAITVYVVPANEAGYHWNLRDTVISPATAGAAPFNGAPQSAGGVPSASPVVGQTPAVSPPIMGRTRDGRDFVIDYPSPDIPELAIVHQVDCGRCFPGW